MIRFFVSEILTFGTKVKKSNVVAYVIMVTSLKLVTD